MMENDRIVIGNNGAPFDFFEFFDLVVNSSATTAEKLLALVTGRHIGRNGEAAYPSRARLIAQASISENTFQRSVAVMRLFFEVEQRKGRATLYRQKPIITGDELELAIRELRPKSTPQNGVHPKKDAPNWGIGTPQNGVGVYPKMGRQKEPLKDPLKTDSPSAGARVVAAVATGMAVITPLAAAELSPAEQILAVPAQCWQTPKAQMTASMNADEARAQMHVWRTPLGAVEISHAFRDELTRTFPLVDLASALAAAAPNVRPDHGAMTCMTQVRRQFGYMQQDAKQRAERAAARASAPPGQKHWIDEEAERRRKFMALLEKK